ncbi:MAG: O-antigen ligase family protein [Burkholderiales bacterium]|nr:O-antigen ligase family protein [Burkholderiales bacterium]
MRAILGRDLRFPLEFALLVALALVLPLREAPKNLLWIAYLLAWLVNRSRTRDFGPRLDRFDLIALAILASAYLAAAFAGIKRGDGNEWIAVNDLVRYLSLFLVVRRAGYAESARMCVVGALVASASLATLEAWWNWRIAGTRKALELASVGHLNHSAIYLVICVGAALGLALALWRSASPALRVALAAAIALLLTALFLGGSRGALLAGVPLVLGLAFIAATRAGYGRGAWAAVLAALLAAIAFGGTEAIQRHFEFAGIDNTTAQRDRIWNRGLAAWQGSRWFGVGLDNYGHFDERQLEAWVAEQGRTYAARDYARAPHGHSLYVNTLVERGIVGACALAALLIAWGVALARARPDFATAGPPVALWCASLAAWWTTVSVGVVNTTLHHEHALLACLCLALWLDRERPPT